MVLSLSPEERVSRARSDLRMGFPVCLVSGDDRVMILAAETLWPERLQDFHDLGAITLGLTARRAQTLKLRAYDTDIARVRLGPDASARLIQSLADPASDMGFPMKGPFETEREGTAEFHRAAISLCKSAHLLPAAVVVPFAGLIPADLTCLPLPMAQASLMFSNVVSARVPLAASEAGRVHVFRPDDGGEEHYAIEIGSPDRSHPVLARLHSACFTGDVLGSLKCDCGPQLRAALAQMGSEGAGVLLYLNQEGRGIGLANKMRAYALQDQGFDTVEANHRLGFEDDERDFHLGADILRKMGFSQVRLMTNNPAKIEKFESCGLIVTERVPLKVGQTEQNMAYLATKAAKSGHML